MYRPPEDVPANRISEMCLPIGTYFRLKILGQDYTFAALFKNKYVHLAT